MQISAETLRDVMLVFHDRLIPADQAQERVGQLGHLSVELLAHLVLRQDALAEHPELRARLVEAARAHYAASQTPRPQHGDIGRVTAIDEDVADALAAIIKADIDAKSGLRELETALRLRSHAQPAESALASFARRIDTEI